MNFETELDTLIQARYPILYLLAIDEPRARDRVLDVARRRGAKVYEWSCTTGLAASETAIQSSPRDDDGTRDPLAALDRVIEHPEPALFLLKDFHPFLAGTHVAVIRRLKEAAHLLRQGSKILLLLSPVLEMPVELERHITVLTHPLPSREDLGRLLDLTLSVAKAAPPANPGLDDAGRDRILQAASGLTLAEASNLFGRLLLNDGRLAGADARELHAAKQQLVRKSGLLDYCAPAKSFDHIGGLAMFKDWVRKRAVAFTAQGRSFGLPAPKGVLILGIEGCGKSLCAQAVSAEWGIPLLRFDPGRLFGSSSGSAEEGARRAFALAESVAPAVLWIDGIDRMFPAPGCAGAPHAGAASRVYGTFLTWLSEKTAPVFVAATAGDGSRLPPELLRKGTLNEVFFADLPEREERIEILQIHLVQRGRDPVRFDLPALADASEDFSGAEIEQAIENALYEAIAAREEPATRHVLNALADTVKVAWTMDDGINQLRSWADGRTRSASVPRLIRPRGGPRGQPT